MKKIIILSAAIAALCSCGTSTYSLTSSTSSTTNIILPENISPNTNPFDIQPVDNEATITSSTVIQTPEKSNLKVSLAADLEVSPVKISFTYKPSKGVQAGGNTNVLSTAIHEALVANGNADVLVGLETSYICNAGKKITSVTVTGYPAKYKNFQNFKGYNTVEK